MLRIEDTDHSFDYWLHRPWVNAELRGRLEKANVIILPRVDYATQSGPLFPEGTERVFKAVFKDSPPEIVPEICVADDEYRELALHDALIVVGTFLVTSIAAPVLANLISNYLTRSGNRSSDTVRVELEIQEGEIIKKLTYEGPAEKFRETVDPAIASMSQSAPQPGLLLQGFSEDEGDEVDDIGD